MRRFFATSGTDGKMPGVWQNWNLERATFSRHHTRSGCQQAVASGVKAGLRYIRWLAFAASLLRAWRSAACLSAISALSTARTWLKYFASSWPRVRGWGPLPCAAAAGVHACFCSCVAGNHPWVTAATPKLPGRLFVLEFGLKFIVPSLVDFDPPSFSAHLSIPTHCCIFHFKG